METLVHSLPSLLWFMAPAYLGNMAPPFLRYWKGWNPPIHAPTLGAHKTVLGYAAGVLVALLATAVQARIHARHLDGMHLDGLLADGTLGGISALVDYRHWFWLGLAFGVGAMSGDCLKSYFKRRRGVPPGARWIPFDQLDFVIGALVLVAPFSLLGWPDVLVILQVSLLGDLAVNRIAYALGIKTSRW
ncbi:MAG: CDP-archaeol synthase [Lysobacteraceae bacterium]|nr:MAG: CDP-archaeol synthase [Xanthomonadaceae bacterium]